MIITAHDIIKELDTQILIEWQKNPYHDRAYIIMNEKDAEILHKHHAAHFPQVEMTRKNGRYMGFRILRTTDLTRLQFVVVTKKEFY